MTHQKDLSLRVKRKKGGLHSCGELCGKEKGETHTGSVLG